MIQLGFCAFSFLILGFLFHLSHASGVSFISFYVRAKEGDIYSKRLIWASYLIFQTLFNFPIECLPCVRMQPRSPGFMHRVGPLTAWLCFRGTGQGDGYAARLWGGTDGRVRGTSLENTNTCTGTPPFSTGIFIYLARSPLWFLCVPVALSGRRGIRGWWVTNMFSFH